MFLFSPSSFEELPDLTNHRISGVDELMMSFGVATEFIPSYFKVGPPGFDQFSVQVRREKAPSRLRLRSFNLPYLTMRHRLE